MRKILVPAVFLALFLSLPAAAAVNVDVNIGIAVPRLVLKAPPVLIVVPGTYVYAVPDLDADLVFYQGFWYRPFRGRWYRSDDYNGRWVVVAPRFVPAPILKLPPNWKRVPPGHERMPYGHVKKNWKTWEREKRWERRAARKNRGRAVGSAVRTLPGPGRGEKYEDKKDDRRGNRGKTLKNWQETRKERRDERRDDKDKKDRNDDKDKKDKDKKDNKDSDNDDNRRGDRGRHR